MTVGFSALHDRRGMRACPGPPCVPEPIRGRHRALPPAREERHLLECYSSRSTDVLDLDRLVQGLASGAPG
ncbi:hypothetical protein ACIPEL_04400 [Streptomyces griseoviridis]